MTALVDARGVPFKVPVVTIGDRVLYALQPKQFQCYALTPLYRGVHAPGPIHIGYGGSAGSGKSFLARAVAMAVAMVWPGSTGIIFRKTEGEVKENHLNKFRTEVPSHIEHEGRLIQLYRWNGEDMCFVWFNGSRTYLGHLKTEEDVFKYQGNEYDFMCFEESTHYSWKQVSWLTNNRLRASVPGTRPFALYPSNPGNRGHFWYKRLFIERSFRPEEPPEDYAFLQAFLADNYELRLRDPAYETRLNRLEEPWRSWLRDGNWSAGAGQALAELNRRVHIVEPFPVPAHWIRFGAFDWGYSHPFSFGEYAVTEDGDLWKLDTIIGRHLLPHEIADRIRAKVDPSRLRYIVAGLDVFHEHKARGENTPTIAEQMASYGFHMTEANVARKFGLNNLRAYLAWKNTGPGGTEGDPALRFFNTPGNQHCFAQLEAMVTDPDDLEDALKTDADEFGEGGDDCYDETRYACASRPSKAPSLEKREPVRAFSREALAYEHERLYRPQDDRPRLPERRGLPPMHHEFGEAF